MRDAKLADTNTRMLLAIHDRLAEAMRIVVWDLAHCTPDEPKVSWDQHAAAVEKLEVAVKVAEQNVAHHARRKKPKETAQ